MDQPLFSCTKCFKTFPKSGMSKSGETCKLCNPNNSSFKQCEFCRSDFKNYIHGSICPRCQTQKYKYGDPKKCSICTLDLAFGNALICQRCTHYKSKFGDPTTCQGCQKICAFIKDEESRKKVDGQTLCWICTYDFKLARNKENPLKSGSKRKPYESHQGHHSHHSKAKTDQKSDFHSSSHHSSKEATKKSEYTSDSLYNEHILTICRQQDEISHLKGQLAAKQADLIDKDRIIAELKSDIIDMERAHKTAIEDVQSNSEVKIEQYLGMVKDLNGTIRQLRLEKNNLSNSMKKKRSTSNLSELTKNPLRMPARKSTSNLLKEMESAQPARTTTPTNSAVDSPKSANNDDVTPSPTPASSTNETQAQKEDSASKPKDEIEKPVHEQEATSALAPEESASAVPRKKIRLVSSSDEENSNSPQANPST